MTNSKLKSSMHHTPVITHSHSSGRVFYRRRRKSTEKAKIRPLATPKPLNRSSQKLAGMITSWTAPGMQNFVAIGSGVSVPQIRDFAVLLGWLVFCSFFGFFNKATAYTPGRIFTQNTSNDVVPSKEVPFGGPNDYCGISFRRGLYSGGWMGVSL